MRFNFLQILVVLLLLFAQDTHAAVRAVNDGEVPVLASDEGLLVISMETPEHVSSLHFNRQGRYVDGETIDDIKPGQTTRLFVVSAGSYQWSDIEFDTKDLTLTFRMGDEPNAKFDVKPGVINYPGELIHYPHGRSASFRIVNRGLMAIDWLNDHDPAALRKYAFQFSGRYADPFPDFYRAAVSTTATTAVDQTRPAPVPNRLSIPVADLWKPMRVGNTGMSPDGSLLAEEIFEDGKHRIDVLDLNTKTVALSVKLDASIRSIDWAGNRAFAVSLDSRLAFGKIYFIRLSDDGKKGLTFEAVNIPYRARLLDALPNDPGHVLLETIDSNGGVMVHQLDTHSAAGMIAYRLSPASRIDSGVPDALSWMSDGSGHLRAAVVRRGGKELVLYGERFASTFKNGTSDADDDQQFYLSNDGNTFYIVTDHGRAQRELVAFEIATGKTSTVFSKPGVDVDEPVFDAQRRLLGVSYHSNGVAVVEYFDQADRDLARRIDGAFPGAMANIVERSDSGKRFIVSVERSDQAPRLYLFDAETSTPELLEDSAPWLSAKHLAAAKTIHANGSDGTPIEAYLTLPVDAHGPSPLIVYSHGGPIGIRDEVAFDRAVQLFASLGYAVLQVNFRGSDGYGKAFRDAGRHHYGSLIEDDIDAATRAVLKEYPIDASRMCAVGASYGGFSALVSAIRWPQRFRCAVSISGVSDQMLMFTASDVAESDDGRQALEQAIGNPKTDTATMQQYSPLFRYQELKLPVMLVHGTKDERVDFEHTRRLVRMLNLAGRPPVMMTLEGEGHGGFESKNEIAMWTGIAGFLEANLDTGPSTAAPTTAY